MSWSTGELKSLATKACRGVGLEWGSAEELAFATCWLLRSKLPAATILADYLQWIIDGSRYNREHDPLLAICEICDHMNWRSPFPGMMYQPYLVVPAISVAAQGTSVAFKVSNSVTIISDDVCYPETQADFVSGSAEFCNVQRTEMSVIDLSFSITSRVDDKEDEAISILQKYASRTYAPATETSRDLGAGAGDDGND